MPSSIKASSGVSSFSTLKNLLSKTWNKYWVAVRDVSVPTVIIKPLIECPIFLARWKTLSLSALNVPLNASLS